MMAMEHGIWLERSETYALGALDGQDLKEFEAHLASGCVVCGAYLRETQQTLTLLHRSLKPVNPPPEIKTKLLRQITPVGTSAIRERLRFNWLWSGMRAGALAAASLLITLSWSLYTTRQEMQKLRADIASIQAAAILHETGIQFLSDPHAQMVHLDGLAASPEASGHLLWNPMSRKGMFIAAGLPKHAADKVYELWAIAGDEPVPAGTFAVGEKPQTLLRLPPLPEGKKFDKFAVTLEPVGGVAKPTGPMLLLGKV
jgi:anti-sigma-K factor RskA